MDKWYWDTSAVIKLYCAESDSKAYISQFSEVSGLFLASQFLEIELFYAIQQKRHRKELTGNEAKNSFEQFLRDKEEGHFALIPLSQAIVEKARELWVLCEQIKPNLTLRSLDGTHLATALDAQCQYLVTADQRMQSIGERLGMNLPDVCRGSAENP